MHKVDNEPCGSIDTKVWGSPNVTNSRIESSRRYLSSSRFFGLVSPPTEVLHRSQMADKLALTFKRLSFSQNADISKELERLHKTVVGRSNAADARRGVDLNTGIGTVRGLLCDQMPYPGSAMSFPNGFQPTPAREAYTFTETLQSRPSTFYGATIDGAIQARSTFDWLTQIFDLLHTDDTKFTYSVMSGIQTITDAAHDLAPVRMVQMYTQSKQVSLQQRGLGFMMEGKQFETPEGQQEMALKLNLVTSAVYNEWILRAIQTFYETQHVYDAAIMTGMHPNPSIEDSLRVGLNTFAMLQKDPYAIERIIVLAKKWMSTDGVTPDNAIFPQGTRAFYSANTSEKLEGPERSKNMKDALAQNSTGTMVAGLRVHEVPDIIINGRSADNLMKAKRMIGDYGRISSYVCTSNYTTDKRDIFMLNMDTSIGSFDRISAVDARLHSGRFDNTTGRLSESHETLIQAYANKNVKSARGLRGEQLDMFITESSGDEKTLVVVDFWGEMMPHNLTPAAVKDCSKTIRHVFQSMPGCEGMNVASVLADAIKLMNEMGNADLCSPYGIAWFLAIEGGSHVLAETNCLNFESTGAPSMPRIEPYNQNGATDSHSAIYYLRKGEKYPVIEVEPKNFFSALSDRINDLDISLDSVSNDLVYALYDGYDLVTRVSAGMSLSQEQKTTIVEHLATRSVFPGYAGNAPENPMTPPQIWKELGIAKARINGKNCFMPWGYGSRAGMATLAAFARSSGISMKSSGFPKHVLKIALDYDAVIEKMFDVAESICADGHVVTEHHVQKPWQRSDNERQNRLTAMANLFVDRNRPFSCMQVLKQPDTTNSPVVEMVLNNVDAIIESYRAPPGEVIYGNRDVATQWTRVLREVYRYAPSFMALGNPGDDRTGISGFISVFPRKFGDAYRHMKPGAISPHVKTMKHSGPSLGNFVSDAMYAYLSEDVNQAGASWKTGIMHVAALLELAVEHVTNEPSSTYSDTGLHTAIIPMVKKMQETAREGATAFASDNSLWMVVNSGLVISQKSYEAFDAKLKAERHRKGRVQIIMTPSIMGADVDSGSVVLNANDTAEVRRAINQYSKATARVTTGETSGFSRKEAQGELKKRDWRSHPGRGMDSEHEVKRARASLDASVASTRNKHKQTNYRKASDHFSGVSFNPSLERNYITASQEPDPLDRFCQQLLIFAPVTSAQMALWEKFDILPPVDYLIERPFKQYQTESMIICKGGESLGCIAYGNEHCVSGHDAVADALYFRYTYLTKVFIKDSKNFVIIPNVRVVGYDGGEGVLMWTPEKFQPSVVLAYDRQSSNNGFRLPSIFPFMCPYGSLRNGEAKMVDNVYVPGLLPTQHSILGYWNTNGFDRSMIRIKEQVLPHYPSAPYYNHVYRFEDLNCVPSKLHSPVHGRSSTGEWNEVTWQAKQLVFDATNGIEKRCVKGCDHFGDDLTDDGVKHKRLGDMVPDQFRRSDLTYDFVVL